MKTAFPLGERKGDRMTFLQKQRSTLALYLLATVGLLFGILLLAGCFSQDTDTPSPDKYLRVHLPDSMVVGDSSKIELLNFVKIPIETLFDGVLSEKSQLEKLKTNYYEGGDCVLRVTRYDQGKMIARLELHFTKSNQKTVIVNLAVDGTDPVATDIVILNVVKDAGMDKTHPASDNGFSPVQGFPIPTTNFVTVMAFNLAGIKQTGLKRATLQLRTFMFPMAYSTHEIAVDVKIRALTQSWKEGTGNWYWHDGGWRNRGDTLLKNYGLPDSVKSMSTNPVIKTGINYAEAAYFDAINLLDVATTTLKVTYTNTEDFVMPKPEDLVEIQLDVTDYMTTADLSKNQGFSIQGATPSGYLICHPTKELSVDLAPHLILYY